MWALILRKERLQRSAALARSWARGRDGAPIAFFSPIISNAQRLWNGNTLINEGVTGRLFEVTAEGEVVWEYVNPYFSGPTARDQQNAVFRAYRYPRQHLPRATEGPGVDTSGEYCQLEYRRPRPGREPPKHPLCVTHYRLRADQAHPPYVVHMPPR